MVCLIWRSDLHLSDTPPQSRVDDWAQVLLGKVAQVGEIARESGAQGVIDGGDFFHVKSPGRNSHGLIQRVADVHKDYPCEVWANVGNHDCVYGDYGYLHQQPLGVLFSTGVFNRLYDEHEALFAKDGVVVRVVGVPYHGTSYDLSRFEAVKKGSEDYLVLAGHVLARSGKGGEGAMFGGEDILGYDFLKTLDADVMAFGHWHKNQGIEEIAPGKWVVNTGSMSRGSLSQDNMERIPSCVVMRFDHGISLNETPLRVDPPEAVFDMDGKARGEAREFLMDTFVERLTHTIEGRSDVELSDLIRGLGDIPDAVKERALLYLEGGP